MTERQQPRLSEGVQWMLFAASVVAQNEIVGEDRSRFRELLDEATRVTESGTDVEALEVAEQLLRASPNIAVNH